LADEEDPMKKLGSWIALALAIGLTGCNSSDNVTNPPGGPGGGSADIDVVSSTPAGGEGNISGSAMTVETQAEDADTTRVEVRDLTSSPKREVLVYFTTATGAVEHVTFSWGVASLLENVTLCDGAACVNASVNTTTQEITLAGVPLDDQGSPAVQATLGQAVPASLIVYP
jgi:hypothetical protein